MRYTIMHLRKAFKAAVHFLVDRADKRQLIENAQSATRSYWHKSRYDI